MKAFILPALLLVANPAHAVCIWQPNDNPAACGVETPCSKQALCTDSGFYPAWAADHPDPLPADLPPRPQLLPPGTRVCAPYNIGGPYASWWDWVCQ